MNEDVYTIQSGLLDVGDGHKINYQEWGNPNVVPIFFLHGGPGGACSDSHKLYFDPKRQRVIFHDQRGCGKSIPFGNRAHNTTDDLVEDINSLRKHLKITGQHAFFGGSWGSCLALVYAIRYPQNVTKMLLRGIYTGTKRETDYIQQEGGISRYAPETWKSYIEVVPDNRRDDIVGYYQEMMQNSDNAVADDHIRRWVRNEFAGVQVDSDIQSLMQNNEPLDDATRSLALLEAHYFANDCFLPNNYILEHAHELAHIQTVLVQGRHDHVCPPETAYLLAQKIGESCRLHIVPSAHSGSEGVMREVLRAYVWNIYN